LGHHRGSFANCRQYQVNMAGAGPTLPATHLQRVFHPRPANPAPGRPGNADPGCPGRRRHRLSSASSTGPDLQARPPLPPLLGVQPRRWPLIRRRPLRHHYLSPKDYHRIRMPLTAC
jgi:hypothetical protein